MASRKDFYFRQKVTEAELDAAFSYLESADFNQAIDYALVGIISGLTVTQRGAGANLSVDVAAGFGYDKLGERLLVGGLQNVDVSVDKDGITTAVSGGANSKKLSVFLKFTRSQLDARTDGNNNTVYFDQPESFEFKVIQSAEAVSPTLPALQSDWILLCDISRAFGQSTIVTGNISSARAEKQFVSAGTPLALSAGTIKAALVAIQTAYNNHVTGAADPQPASNVTYAGGPAWADGTTNPTVTVEAQLDKILTDLGGSQGALKVGATITNTWRDATGIAGVTVDAAIEEIVSDLAAQSSGNEGALRIGAFTRTAGSKTLAQGTTGSQLLSMLTIYNNHITGAADPHNGTDIQESIAATWADSTGIAALTVDACIEEIVNDLKSATISVSGGGKIGLHTAATWADTTPLGDDAGISPINVKNGVDAIVGDIANIDATNSGSYKIGHDGTTTFNDKQTLGDIVDSMELAIDQHIYGSGADGSLSSASGTTTLADTGMYTAITLSSTGAIDTAGFILMADLSLSLSGTAIIGRQGNAAASATAGAAHTATYDLNGGRAGANGAAGPAGGTGGSGAGGGARFLGGAGGGGGWGGVGAGAGGTRSTGFPEKRMRAIETALTMNLTRNDGVSGSIFGGAGGGGGGAAASSTGGGGGGGGGVVVVRARRITWANTAQIRAQGGIGGNAAGTTAGGGGGGGGGVIFLVYRYEVGSRTTSVIGGTGGNQAGAGGNGVSGSAGQVYALVA